MEGPKISIIIPAYNLESCMEHTLNSVTSQTFPSLELVLVNDGSTDNTLQIAREVLGESGIDYQILDQVNQGVSQARNAGIRAAQGEYLFFLDGDDYLEPDCLEKMYQALVEHHAQTAYASYVKVTDTGERLDSTPLVELPEISSAEYLIRLELSMAITFSFCQLLYPRRLVREKGIYFNPKLRYGEDTDFALRVLAHLESVAYVPEELIYYVQRGSSSTRKTLLDRYDFITALDGVKKYYQEQHISAELVNLIDHNRIPKSIMGNTNYMLDEGLTLEEVVEELRRRNLLSRLNDFQPAGSRDYRFMAKTRLFTISPRLYYHLRQLI
jgi:glycosyltransferase involved in cell wall biosynthesis